MGCQQFVWICNDSRFTLFGIKWLSDEEINNFDLNIGENSPIGYILECDLKYPKKLHDLHSDYPLCPLCTNFI